MTAATLNRRLSRRVLLAGGGGAALATAIWRFSGPLFRSDGPGGDGQEVADLAGCFPYTDYDGWLVSVPDRRLLAFPVRYTEGWYPEESDQETTWRWSSRTARLQVPNPGVEAVLDLDYDMRAELFRDPPRTFSVSTGGRVLQTFVADVPGRRRHGIPLPVGTLGHGDTAEIELATDRHFVPADRIAGSRDSRELGVLVYGVEIRESP